jgi:hypothetical protein
MTVHSNWRDDAACRDADWDCSSRSARPGPRCATLTRRNGSAGPARRRLSTWPGRWTTQSPMVYGGGTTADERRAIGRLASRAAISQE